MVAEDLVRDEALAGLSGKDAARFSGPGTRLWHNRNFNMFWFGQSLSSLGDAFAMIATPLLVLQATGSVAQMGLVTGTFGALQLVTGIFSGALVDRLDRRRLMIACDLGRLVVYSLIPAGWLLAGPQIWLIYVTTALGSMLGNVFGVAYITAVPNLVDKDQITEANGRLQISGGLSFVIGPVLAGVVTALFNPAAAIGVDAVSFLISALSLMLIRLRPTVVIAAAISGARATHLDELLAGIRFLFHQPLLRTVTIVFGIVNMVLVGGMDLFIYRLKHDLHQSAGTVGLVFGLASMGAIFAGILTPLLRRRFGFAVCWIGGLWGSGLALVAFALSRSIPLVVLVAILFALVNTVMNVTNMSLRQEITPDHLLGRVTAAFWTLAGVAAPVGATVSTLLAAQFGAPAILTGMGVITAIMAAISIATPVNHRRPELLYARDDAPATVAVAAS